MVSQQTAQAPSTKLPMPANSETERALLGAIVLDNRLIIDAIERLPRDDRGVSVFSEPANQSIYNVMLDLHNAGVGFDLTILSSELHRRGVLEAIGGPSYLAGLEDNVFALGQTPEYARIVADYWRRRVIVTMARRMAITAVNTETKVDDILSGMSQSVCDLAMETRRGDFVSLSDSVIDQIAEIEAYATSGVKPGIPTGFHEFDRLTGGLHPSQLIIAAARPSVGKSAFVSCILRNVAASGRHAGLFNLEMSRGESTNRLISVDSHVPLGYIQGHYPLSVSQRDSIHYAGQKLASLPLYIDDSAGLTIAEMNAKARKLKTKHPELAVIAVDYLQLMSAGKRRGYDNKNAEVTEISRALKLLAKELSITVIALSQLSRDVEKRQTPKGQQGKGQSMPKLSDLRESGAIEQDADVVVFLHRDLFIDRDQGNSIPVSTRVRIAKQRNGGVGDFELGFIRELTKFVNME